MFLSEWLKRRRPPNPIPAEVEKVNRHTDELRDWVVQLRAATKPGRQP